MKDRYPTSTMEEMAELLPGRTRCAINIKAHKLGISKTPETTTRIKQAAMLDENGHGRFWQGGTYLSNGYRFVQCPGHPRADASGYVQEHILIMESIIGGHLPEGTVVHHLNGKRADNDPSNLALMSRGGHARYHHKGKKMSEEARRKISETKRRQFAERRAATNGTV